MRRLLILAVLALLCISLYSQEKSYIQVNAESGIAIYINDQFVAETSSELNGLLIDDLSPGVYKIKVEKPGFASREEKITLKKGEVMIFNVNLNVPDVSISEYGNKVDCSLKLKTGTLLIQSVPVNITIKIPWLKLITTKSDDSWMADDLAVGVYAVSFHWSGETLVDTVFIKQNKKTHLMVNFLEMKIYYPDRKDVYYSAETAPVKKKESPVDALALTFTDSRDGKTYKQVKIGEQVWMAENLNYDAGSESWCYANDASNCAKYGRLYNWESAMKVCPSGWHLPTDDEWKTLEMHYGMEQKDAYNLYWRGTDQGTKLKKNDDGDFCGLLGGRRDISGDYGYLDTYGYYWSATDYKETHAWYRLLYSGNLLVYRFRTDKNASYNVRCIRD